MIFAKSEPSTDTERLAKLAAARRKLAESVLCEERAAELRNGMAAIDQELDVEASRHVEQCRGLQAELTKLEELQISNIVDRVPKDADAEARRLQLVAQLEQMNLALKETVARVTKRRDEVAEEHLRLIHSMTARKMFRSCVEDEVRRLADPEILNELQGLRQAARLIEQASSMPTENLKQASSETARARWRAVNDALGLATQALSERERELSRQIENESTN